MTGLSSESANWLYLDSSEVAPEILSTVFMEKCPII